MSAAVRAELRRRWVHRGRGAVFAGRRCRGDFGRFVAGDRSVLGRLYSSLEPWAMSWNEPLNSVAVVLITLASLIPRSGDPYHVVYVGCAAMLAAIVTLLSMFEDGYMDVAAKLRCAFELLLLALRAAAGMPSAAAQVFSSKPIIGWM